MSVLYANPKRAFRPGDLVKNNPSVSGVWQRWGAWASSNDVGLIIFCGHKYGCFVNHIFWTSDLHLQHDVDDDCLILLQSVK